MLRLMILILILCSSPIAFGKDLAMELLGISIQASLQTTTEATFAATTEESSPTWHCRQGRRYSTCSLVDPDVGDQLVREAFSGDGQALNDFADGLGMDRAALAGAIVDKMPAQPTRSDLRRVLVISLSAG